MFFLFIFIILLILFLAICTSVVRIEIQNLEIDTERPKNEKINKEGKIFLYILIFNKIKILKRNLREIDTKKIKFQNKDLDIKFLKDRDIKINYKDLMPPIDIFFDKIDLNIKIGTEDAAITALLTGIIASILGIILKKPKFEIIPIFSNKNFLKIRLDCIFSVHLMQYIYKIISNKNKDLGKNRLNKKVEV